MTKALILCANRNLTLPTFVSILTLLGTRPGWHLLLETGDALISRARSIAASRWLRECPDDEAFLMIDDDFQFTPEAAEDVIGLAIEKRGIAAGVTPLRSGEFTAIVPLSGEREMWLDPSQPPVEIKWAGGFLAYHRSVFETLSRTLPLLHERDVIPAFWPFFMPMVVQLADGRHIYLSEDYSAHERARQAGFTVWVQPSAHIGHLAELMVTTTNMPLMRQLLRGNEQPAG